MKTPFLMHPVEAVRVLANEIKIFTPQTIAYLSKELGISKEEVIIDVLIAAFLHDAVEDKDITEKDLRIMFGDRVADIVLMLSKEEKHKGKIGEAIYLKNIVNRTDIIGLLAQLIKIADRMHNLNTLKGNEPEFQRKIFFHTRDIFIPELIDKIDLEAIKNKQLRKIFERVIEELFKDQI